MKKNILLMYISEHSGHHQASIALEKAILKKCPESSVLNVNAFRLTNPIMERVTHKAYMGVIKKHPSIWGNLYDNPKVVKKTERIRSIFNNAGSKKLEKLVEKFKPDAVACTQAFPCGIMGNYKKTRKVKTPLVGVLTDYAPHSYWMHDEVDAYIVPSEEIKDALVKKRIPAEKIHPLGTPIDPIFTDVLDKDNLIREMGLSTNKPVILVMGGTYGIGPDEKLIRALEGCKKDIQVVVATGVNKKLFDKVLKLKAGLQKKVIVLSYSRNVHELMEIADLIITKPGGLTVAEALAKSLPMVILNPLPGQEDLNTKILTKKGIAIKAADEKDAVLIVDSLLEKPDQMDKMRDSIKAEAKPYSAFQTADLLLQLSN